MIKELIYWMLRVVSIAYSHKNDLAERHAPDNIFAEKYLKSVREILRSHNAKNKEEGEFPLLFMSTII